MGKLFFFLLKISIKFNLKVYCFSQGLLASSQAELLQPKKSKGRTGWPQHVWAAELKQEQ